MAWLGSAMVSRYHSPGGSIIGEKSWERPVEARVLHHECLDSTSAAGWSFAQVALQDRLDGRGRIVDSPF